MAAAPWWHSTGGWQPGGRGVKNQPQPRLSRQVEAAKIPAPPLSRCPCRPARPPRSQAGRQQSGAQAGVQGDAWPQPPRHGVQRAGGSAHRGAPDITCSANGFLGFVVDVITWVWGGRDVLALPRQQRVVLLPVVVGVKEFLEPLDELKIVLELALHQPLHCDDLGGHGGAVGQCSQRAPNTAGTPAR